MVTKPKIRDSRYLGFLIFEICLYIEIYFVENNWKNMNNYEH